MARRIGKKTILLDHPVTIVGYGSVVGKMEGKGPYGGYFDQVIEDSRFGEDTFEQAESKLQRRLSVLPYSVPVWPLNRLTVFVQGIC